jgi:hypothetical protein
MAEYLLASGSRKISALTTVSGISGSTSMPIVMGGSTVQVSHTDFVNSTVFNRTLVSGSAQVIQLLPNGTVSGSSQVSFNGISDKPTLVSSSQQVLGYGIFTTTASFNAYTSSNDGRVNSLTSATASYATTSSNRFIGNQTITGSLLVTGSVNIIGGVTGSSFTGSFRGDGSGLTGVPSTLNTGSFAITGSNTFRGNQIISASVDVSGSVSADMFKLDASLTTNVPALNPEFNVNFTGVSNIVNKTLVLENGKVLVAGRFSDIDSHVTDDIARFNSNGTIDTGFSAPSIGGGLSAAFQYINTFVTQSNNKIIIVGSFTEVDGSDYSGVARLNSDGTLDNTFTNPALTTFTEVRDVLIQSDDKVVVVGNFDGGIKRLQTDGTIDTSLNVPDSTGFTNNSFYAVASQTVSSTDYLLVGGSFLQWNTLANYKRIARIGISGSLDGTYAGTNLNITSAGGLISKIKLDSNNDVYIAGRFVGSTNRNRNIAKLITDADFTTTGPGELDLTFATWLSGGTNDGWARDFEIVDGKVLIGGEFGFAGRSQFGTQYSATDFVIVNESDGAPIDNWSSGNYTFNNVVYSVTSLTGSNVLVGGNFSTVNSFSREDLASLKTSGIGTFSTINEYQITANISRLLISSSNTHFSGDVNISGSVTASVFTGSFRGDGSGLTGVNISINTGSFATTGSNIFRGNQTITGSVGVSGSVNANEFQLGSGVTNLENTAYWLYGNYNNAGAISFGFSTGNVIANIDNVYINETSSDINGAAIVDSASWLNGLAIGSVITIQGIDSAPSNITQTIVLSVNSITNFSGFGRWAIGVSVLSYLPLAPSIAVNNSVYSLTYTTTIGDGSQYTITSDETRLLVSSSNTQFSGDVNVTGSITSQLFLNPQTITQELIVPSGFNGMLIGPISLEGGMGVSSGSVLVVM